MYKIYVKVCEKNANSGSVIFGIILTNIHKNATIINIKHQRRLRMFINTHTSYLLYNNSDSMFNLTYREKDFSCMSKAQIQIEFAEIFTQFLSLRLTAEDLFEIIKQIPLQKLPKFQRETLGYTLSISLRKVKVSEPKEFNKKSSQFIWTFEASGGKIRLMPELIELKKFPDNKLKESIIKFASVWKYI